MEEAPRRQASCSLGFKLSILAGIIGCCLGVWFAAIRPMNGIWVGDLEADIREHLPVGSTREAVATWFASRGIETWEMGDEECRKVGLGGTIPNSTWLEHVLHLGGLIDIEIYFDRDGRVKGSSVNRSSTWP